MGIKPVFNPPLTLNLGMDHLCGCVSVKKGAEIYTKLCAKHLKEAEKAADSEKITHKN